MLIPSGYILLAFVYVAVHGDPVPYCGETFRLASYYGNTMVLQRAPVRARIWGYAFAAGDEVMLNITNDSSGEIFQYITTAVDGTVGFPIWQIDIDPMLAGGPYTVHVSSMDCVISLHEILFGDVWLCSGQSNMDHMLKDIDDPDSDIDSSVNYPNIRSFYTARRTADVPQEDLIRVIQNWAIVDPDHIGDFSAVCYLFGRHLYDKYEVPVGLILSSWGGTRIETWSSPEALEICFPDGVPPGEGIANDASSLYNSMIHPFLQLPIFGVIWYQGESNDNNADDYGCAIREMVNDWRKSWFEKTDTMDPQFPFGEVQLAPNIDNDTIIGFPDIRWQQTLQFGYVPNEQLQRFFMAVAMDLPDFDSPFEPIHPRFKRPIAQRLALGAFVVAYNDTSNGTFQGPLPSSVYIDANNNITISMGDGSQELEQRGDPSTYDGYEVCCSFDPTNYCELISEAWLAAEILSVETGHVTISMPCIDRFPTGLRYGWRESPCRIIEECPIYATVSGNNLPAPPFLYNGLIE